MTFRWSVRLLLVLVTLSAGFEAARAQELAMAKPRFIATWVAAGQPDDASGSSMLQRRVSLDLADVPIATALRQVASQARLDLSYDKSVLPHGRRVSLHVQELTVVAALTEILIQSGLDVAVGRSGQLGLVRKPGAAAADSGSIVGRITDKATGAPIVGATIAVDGTSRTTESGEDGSYRLANLPIGSYTVRARYIGYAPARAVVTLGADQEVMAEFALVKTAQQLDEVVTTGTAGPTEVRAIPTPIAVITAKDIELQGITRSEDLLRLVPGVGMMNDDRDGYYSRLYVRGASTFDNSSIKTYIDGVEVANPAYTLNQIDPSSIERIEVVRGPQASTMYGSEAIAGVMQIFTKKGSGGLRRPQVNAKVSGGVLQSPYQDRLAPVQSHSFSLMGGETNFSYNLGAAYESTGEWIEDELIDQLGWDVPNSSDKQKSLHGGLRYTAGRVTAELSARVVNKSFGRPLNKILADKARSGEYNFAYFTKPVGTELDMGLQTYGLTLRYAATPRWQHNLTLGYDFTAWEQAQTQRRLVTPADTFLNFSRNDWSKFSVAYNTALRVPLGPSLETTLQAGYDQWEYEQNTTFTADALQLVGGFLNRTATLSRGNLDNHGFFAQAQTGWRDQLFLTLGMRADGNSGFGDDLDYAWSPRVGLAHVADLGGVTLKTRASWGSAVKPPAPTAKLGQIFSHAVNLPNPGLAPERQTGYDAGAELYFGSRFSLQATYYDQDAEDLIALERLNGFEERPQIFQHQNVGRINNQGWEFEATANLAPFIVAAHYSVVNSTVEELAATYTGDLEVGEATIAIPENTARISLTYVGPRTSVTLGVNHIGPRRNYQLIPYYTALFGTDPDREPYRGSFGAYLVDDPAMQKYELSAVHQFNEQFGAFLDVDNLFDNQNPESGDLSLVRGRQVVVGLRVQH